MKDMGGYSLYEYNDGLVRNTGKECTGDLQRKHYNDCSFSLMLQMLQRKL